MTERDAAAPGQEHQSIAAWAAGFDRRSWSGVLPPHRPDCLGCGPDNPHGHHMQVRRDGDGVVTEHVFDGRHVGAPGIAHGGAVATVVDDLFGFLLYLVGEPAVTRHLEVDYRAPVWLGRTYRIRAGQDRRDGRKLFVSATGTDDSGTETFTARALFVVVPLEHFAGRPSAEGPPIAP